MNPELNNNPEHHYPFSQLLERIDYLDASELHGIVISKLVEIDQLSDDLLIAGFPKSSTDSTKRTTYAYTLEETNFSLSFNADHDTPYEYANESLKNGDVGTVAVYDRSKFVEIGLHHYELKDAVSIDDAILFRVDLVPYL